jgi:restriction endonuclease S subunit
MKSAPTPRTPRNDASWPIVRLADVCELNPRRPTIARSDDAPTTFVSMSAVSENGHGITGAIERPFRDVKKGYTYFAKGDVLFAKITPCMQNGKHAIARDLIDGFGFGSTEFHVLRPGKDLLAEWVHGYLLQSRVLQEAEAHFTGSVGQQRVPADYLASLCIPLPPLQEQKRITARMNEQLAVVERAATASSEAIHAAAAVLPRLLGRMYTDDVPPGSLEVSLGELLELRKDVVHPRDNPRGAAHFVGLEHIESGTGRRLGGLAVRMENLTGRKPRFYKGDIVYGYLRPYLNKVWLADSEGLCSVDQYVYRADVKKVRPEYVAWFMRSPAFLRRAPISFTPGQLPRIRTDEVAQVRLSVPSLHDQDLALQKLDREIKAAYALRSALSDTFVSLTNMPNALLREAFAGAQ